METAADENSENLAVSVDDAVKENHDNSVSDMSNHVGMESPEFSVEEVRSTLETSASTGGTESPQFSVEEVRRTLETSASTGRFWQDWEKLKNVLSYHLKQVLSEYPEAKMTIEQQTSSLGENFQVLVKRLDDAIHSFDEGPPFTLQRLCEILLSARSIYPKLSKLALALEKNLLVTSTLTISNNCYQPATEQNSNGAYEECVKTPPRISSVENGVPIVGDRDEIMAEVEETEVNEDMTMDMESIEEIVRSSEANPTPTVDS